MEFLSISSEQGLREKIILEVVHLVSQPETGKMGLNNHLYSILADIKEPIPRSKKIENLRIHLTRIDLLITENSIYLEKLFSLSSLLRQYILRLEDKPSWSARLLKLINKTNSKESILLKKIENLKTSLIVKSNLTFEHELIQVLVSLELAVERNEVEQILACRTRIDSLIIQNFTKLRPW